MNCELHAGPFACNGVLELANEFACCICLIDDAELASTHWWEDLLTPWGSHELSSVESFAPMSTAISFLPMSITAEKSKNFKLQQQGQFWRDLWLPASRRDANRSSTETASEERKEQGRWPKWPREHQRRLPIARSLAVAPSPSTLLISKRSWIRRAISTFAWQLSWRLSDSR